jgi:hypothetical protein
MGVVAPHLASAQVATTATTTATTAVPTSTVTCSLGATTPTITQTSQFAPIRFVGTQNLGTTTRPVSQNQTGISYQDCISDQVLQFSVQACGFLGSDNLEVWASTSSDCTDPTARGQSLNPVCWQVVAQTGALTSADNTQTISIRVRDIVSHVSSQPTTTTFVPAGIEACSEQAGFTQINVNVSFIPVNSSSAALDGTAYEYPILVDMVGPPAPTNLVVGRGDTLLTTSWTANLDTDTTGYDVIIDPLPGQGTPANTTSTTNTGTSTTVLVCDDAGDEDAGDAMTSDAMTSDASDAMSSTDATLDATADATVATPATPMGDASVPAGCHLESIANTNNNTNTICSDSLLTSGVINDGGGTSTTTEVPTAALDAADDGGADAETTVVTTGGGIYIPPAGHVLNLNPQIGSTVTGGTSSTFLIKGLLDEVNYNVVVAAVDNFGNVGPPSGVACGIPAPVNDFWKDYRDAGGQAGGGFCALEAVGAPAASTVAFGAFGALFIAGFRRRRDRRSGRRS